MVYADGTGGIRQRQNGFHCRHASEAAETVNKPAPALLLVYGTQRGKTATAP